MSSKEKLDTTESDISFSGMQLGTDQQFHDFRLLEFCGRGTFGEVWRAVDISGKIIAIKIISKELLPNVWQREFNGIKNYRKVIGYHPNLIQIYHIGEAAKYFYYTMEAADNRLAPGLGYKPDTLASRIEASRLPAEQIISIALALLDGIEVLHQTQLVHRDIKPANIIFVNGVPKLSDIGLVSLDRTNLSLAGTIGFIPPEDLTCGDSSSGSKPQSDLYALGKVIYCALTGMSPSDFPNMPKDISLSVCKRLNRIICMACHKKTNARIKSAGEFRALLIEAETDLSRTISPWNDIKNMIFRPLRKTGSLMNGYRRLPPFVKTVFMIAFGTCIATGLLEVKSKYFSTQPSTAAGAIATPEALPVEQDYKELIKPSNPQVSKLLFSDSFDGRFSPRWKRMMSFGGSIKDKHYAFTNNGLNLERFSGELMLEKIIPESFELVMRIECVNSTADICYTVGNYNPAPPHAEDASLMFQINMFPDRDKKQTSLSVTRLAVENGSMSWGWGKQHLFNTRSIRSDGLDIIKKEMELPLEANLRIHRFIKNRKILTYWVDEQKLFQYELKDSDVASYLAPSGFLMLKLSVKEMRMPGVFIKDLCLYELKN